MIAATRAIMSRRIAPVHVPAATAPVNEIVLRDNEIDLTALPVPKFWRGDGGRYIGTGDITGHPSYTDSVAEQLSALWKA
jgi:4-hydroxy-3-polyprenylbenzoate decarboxylase